MRDKIGEVLVDLDAFGPGTLIRAIEKNKAQKTQYIFEIAQAKKAGAAIPAALKQPPRLGETLLAAEIIDTNTLFRGLQEQERRRQLQCMEKFEVEGIPEEQVSRSILEEDSLSDRLKTLWHQLKKDVFE